MGSACAFRSEEKKECFFFKQNINRLTAGVVFLLSFYRALYFFDLLFYRGFHSFLFYCFTMRAVFFLHFFLFTTDINEKEHNYKKETHVYYFARMT